jgi:drug/metabolite transporter (DMT)-like permease
VTAPSRATPSSPLRTSAWLPAFLLLGLVWGCSFAFTRVSLRSLSPVQVAAGRILLGATALLMLTAVTRTRLPRGRIWWHLTVVGALLNAVPFTLFSYGQQYISSVLAGIINAATPLATLLAILLAFPEEKPNRERVAGLAVGFAGVCVVLGVWRGFTGGEWNGILACLAAVGCYGLAFPYARRYVSGAGRPPVALATGQLVTASVMMLPVLVVSGTTPHAPVTVSVVTSMLLLGIFGSGVAYVLNFHVIAAAGASIASTVTYVTPVVAAAVGVLLLGERVSWNEPLGGLIVLAGVAVAQGRLRMVRRHATSPHRQVCDGRRAEI